ncbi:MAG: RiPP maturation radical SAM C-methyltransferase [Deltaproteobacteria bacterium]|nr:RiPP maturation radical SAM C-methyltransferase [Deltaproteobacteria bacterium]
MHRIALISTPWPLFNRPSVQLGALKAFVKQSIPGLQVDTHHIYLSIAEGLGYNLYGEISERTWLAESLYAGLLYPDRTTTISRFWKKRSSGLSLAHKVDFDELCRKLEKSSVQVLESVDWGNHLLAGFSICLGQLTSSLYFIREIKKRTPDLKVVVGGSACAGALGEGLIRTFPEIDFIIRGEGELPLVHLIKSLASGQDDPHMVPIPGLISRHKDPPDQEIFQVSGLDELPGPEYGDYFDQVRSLGPDKAFLPKIPMEISRGCWWRKSIGPGSTSGCAFCNLNLQWKGYRAKSHDKIIKELETLTDQYQVLSVSFMDNLLPAKGLEQLFRRIQEMGKDLRLFCEIRATTTRKVLGAMGAAGMREIQVGIESLSTSLLKKINKGTTAIDNLEIMKNCETPGLPHLTGNLILTFPSSDELDVKETLANLNFVLPFRPLKGIPFWLGYGSSVWQIPNAYGIKRVRNHPFYAHLFPPDVLRGLSLMIQGYQGGVRYQNRLWQPVREKIEAWHKSYSELHKDPGYDPILSFQDGRDFMIIRERRPGNFDMTHRLKGTSRKIYLFCRTQQSISQILSQFPGFGEEKVIPFLRMMVEKRLIFHEGERYLSLAVPVKTQFFR